MTIQTYNTKLEFDFCVMCHRHTSLGHMTVLWEEYPDPKVEFLEKVNELAFHLLDHKTKKVRICSWCNNGE